MWLMQITMVWLLRALLAAAPTSPSRHGCNLAGRGTPTNPPPPFCGLWSQVNRNWPETLLGRHKKYINWEKRSHLEPRVCVWDGGRRQGGWAEGEPGGRLTLWHRSWHLPIPFRCQWPHLSLRRINFHNDEKFTARLGSVCDRTKAVKLLEILNHGF